MWHQRLSPPSSEYQAPASGDSLMRSAIWVLQRSMTPGMPPGFSVYHEDGLSPHRLIHGVAM
jgi:hypothetical protein